MTTPAGAPWSTIRTTGVALMWRFSRHIKLLVDGTIWALTIPFAFVLRLEMGALEYLDALALYAAVAIPVHALVGLILRLHHQSWGKIGLRDLRRLLGGVGVATALLFLVAWGLQAYAPVPRSIPLLSGMMAALALGGVRMLVRVAREEQALAKAEGGTSRNVVILGAGEAGTLLCREMLRHPELGMRPVAFLDDNPKKLGVEYMGVRVIGSLPDLPAVARRTGATEALLAIPSASQELRRNVLESAKGAQIALRIVPGIYDLLGGDSPARVREVLDDFVVKGRPRNVLVIGGAGYIGSALIPQLLDRGYNVRVLDFLIYGVEPLRVCIDHPRFELIEGDFRQINNVVAAMRGIDTVVHLGALVGDPACALDEELTVEINLMATKMIAEVAKGSGISRFIFASTCSVYGASDEILDENSPLNPLSLYARTKIASEKVLMRMENAHFTPTILRFGTVYGFSGRTRFDLVVNLLTAKAVNDNLITLYGGDQWRPFIHVHDVAKAVRMTLEAPADRVGGMIMNVGSDAQNYTLHDVARIIQQAVPHAKVVDNGADSDRRNYRVSFNKIEETIGFGPDWALDDGVRQVIQALNEGRVKDYRDATYSNVRFLSEEGLSKIVRREFGRLFEALETGRSDDAEVRLVPKEK